MLVTVSFTLAETVAPGPAGLAAFLSITPVLFGEASMPEVPSAWVGSKVVAPLSRLKLWSPTVVLMIPCVNCTLLLFVQSLHLINTQAASQLAAVVPGRRQLF